MSVTYLETDTTDEGSICWYSIDGETYGFTSDGRILDRDGVSMPEDFESLSVLVRVAEFEAAK